MLNAAASKHPEHTTRILCVDDDEIIREIMTELLSSDYELLTVSSGEECLGVVCDFAPDIILMDVQMGGIDGYETCSRLKKARRSSDIPVIFVSALSSNEERLAGYNAGGEDYITKPFNEDELKFKIRNTLQNLDRLHELESSTREALTVSGEIRLVTRFMRDTFSCHSPEELAKNVLSVLEAYALDGSVQFCIQREAEYWSTRGNIGPLEKAALDYILTHGKLKTSDQRLMTSIGNVAVLISNMPQDDEARFDRLEENLSLMVESADARLNFLATQKHIDKQREVLREVEASALAALTSIDENYKSHQASSRDILSSLGQKIEASYYSFALNEEQEGLLTETVQTAEKKMSELFEEGLQLDNQFNTIISGIRETLGTS